MVRVRVLMVVFGLSLCGALAAAGPAAAATGSISGTVTDALSGEGIGGGLEVCAVGPLFGPFGECGFTKENGDYTILNLQPSFYRVVFAEETRENYLEQWYDGKATKAEAEPVIVGDGEAVTGKDAALAVGGQITGTVTDAATGLPVAGVQVCAPPDLAGYEGVVHCARSKSAGEYTVQSLPTGSYTLEFFVESSPNYIRQYYPGRAAPAEAEAVSVVAGATRTGLDAVMQPGIQITGRLTEVGTGNPVKWVGVCAWQPSTETRSICTESEPGGAYSIAGLPLGSYVVGFAVDGKEDGIDLHPDGYVRQYYDHKETFAAADLVAGPASAVYTGIDGELTQGPEVWPEEAVPLVPPATRTVPPPPHRSKCRKGLHRKNVRGQSRCVRKAKKHRHGWHRAAARRKPTSVRPASAR